MEIVKICNYNNKKYGDIYNYINSKNINSNEPNWPKHKSRERKKKSNENCIPEKN